MYTCFLFLHVLHYKGSDEYLEGLKDLGLAGVEKKLERGGLPRIVYCNYDAITTKQGGSQYSRARWNYRRIRDTALVSLKDPHEVATSYIHAYEML